MSEKASGAARGDSFRYRVRLFNTDATEEVGPPSGLVRVTAIPPEAKSE